jgi:type VI secretion system secreted protein VgrG
MDHFETALKITLAHEGGYVDDPQDAGGATNYGLTLADWLEYYKTAGSADLLKNLTVEKAGDMYLKLWWLPLKLDLVTSTKIATVIFDQAVLDGKENATVRVQQILGLKPDGVMGHMTIAALNGENEDCFCFRFLRASAHHYDAIVKDNLTDIKYLDGWLDRVFSLLDFVMFGDAT